MSYLNRFLIEEDAQFECVASLCIWDIFDKTSLSLKPINEIESIIGCSLSSLGQFIIAGGPNGKFQYNTMYRMSRLIQLVKQKSQAKLHLNIMVTFIGCARLECVQTDRFKKFYKESGKIKYKNQILNAYKSVGDDLEVFFQRNKNEMITANELEPFKLELGYLEPISNLWRVEGHVFPHKDKMLLLRLRKYFIHNSGTLC